MPARSKAQSELLNARFGHAWVVAHGFDNSTANLPEHVAKRQARHLHKKRKRRG